MSSVYSAIHSEKVYEAGYPEKFLDFLSLVIISGQCDFFGTLFGCSQMLLIFGTS